MSYVAATLRIVADEKSELGYALYAGDQRLRDDYLEHNLRDCIGGTITFEAYTEEDQGFRKFDRLD